MLQLENDVNLSDKDPDDLLMGLLDQRKFVRT